MNFNHSNKILREQNGYTLLFAVLTASLVLSVAVFILSISRGQYLLASTARESTYAIYAADSGIECAANVATSLSTTTPVDVQMPCAGNPNTILAFSPPGWMSVTAAGLSGAKKVSLTIDLGDGKCAAISFIKGVKVSDPSIPVTQIESRGYNYCTGAGPTLGPDTSNPKVVERAIRLTYVGM